MRTIILASLSSAAVLAAGTAMAGGVVGPVVEASPIQVAPAPVMGAWEGAYAGGSLGYILGTDDQLGLALLSDGEQVDRATNLGDLGMSGATLGLHAGYRWQRDRWVFGPELGVEFGSVDEEISFTVDDFTGSAESKMNNVATLVMKTGYAVDPQTLVYGTFGIARGDFDYTLRGEEGSTTQGFTATGIAAGLGAERMINDRMSVFAEYQYRDFGNETVNFDAGEGDVLSTRASVSMSTIKIGANFKF
ncbi:MAG: outer membrane protein [Paracoccus hibiscisoli]|uniref:outer membrane protein n=1 Tax=Paracoccus hibiscisoli TaxID=2023261 RepID=UPI003919A23E